MSYREVPGFLINKYHLSPEDIDDVRSEIASSDLEYGYQRNIEYIIIDYFEKTKHYKRNHKTGKREFKTVFVEYAETSSESDSDGRVTTAINSGEHRNYGVGYEPTELVEQHSKLTWMKNIIELLPYTKKIIMEKSLEGKTKHEIADELGFSESRCFQVQRVVVDKMSVLSILDHDLALAVAKVIKW